MPSRRTFLHASAITAAAAPAIFTSKRAAAQNTIGSGEHTFHYDHAFPKLPAKYHWQITHNVAVDPTSNDLYVIHEGDAQLTDHPSIFVFDSQGEFIRAFGEQFQGGGHGVKIRVEGGTPFLYVAAYQQVKSIAKLTLTGEIVWQQYAPVESGKYAPGEASNPSKAWGSDRFMPTNFAFTDDGGFLLTDGYGTALIHRYDAEGTWQSCFGGRGKGRGTFNLPHGVWVDQRDGGPAEVVVTDRAHNTLQVFDLEGKYKKTVEGFGLPANVDTFADQMVVPELVARVSILDRNHNTLCTLGDDRERLLQEKRRRIRRDESQWIDGKFVHPHDACYDNAGDLYVAEWVSTGRVTKLTRA